MTQPRSGARRRAVEEALFTGGGTEQPAHEAEGLGFVSRLKRIVDETTAGASLMSPFRSVPPPAAAPSTHGDP